MLFKKESNKWPFQEFIDLKALVQNISIFSLYIYAYVH